MVLVIISMLVSMVYPQYSNYLTRARRLDGQTGLIALANRMEWYFSKHHSYKNATIGSDKATDVLPQPLTEQGWYTLSIIEATDTSYLLQATPQRAQARNDTLCQSLTLNQFGVSGITAGPAGEPMGPLSRC